jgi:predicted phosphodiesterase
VIQLLKQNDIETVRGNYDEVVSGMRASSGADYTTEREEAIDIAAIEWTKQNLTPESRKYLSELPRESRLQVSASGRTAFKGSKGDEKISEYRRNFILGAIFGGLASPSRRPRINARRVLLVHGSPRDTVEYLYPGTARSVLRTISQDAEAEVIMFGHTHQGYQEVVDGVAFISVPSVGRPRAGGPAEYAVVEIAGPEIEVEYRTVEYDLEAEVRDIESTDLPRDLGEYLRSGNTATSL